MKLFLLVCVVIVGVAHCDFTGETETSDITFHGFEIYRKIYDSSKNLVFSPLSFRVLYSILYQISFGDSENELRSQLFADVQVADKATIQSEQTYALNRILSSPQIKLANKVYLAEGSTLSQNFRTIVAQYKSEVEQVSFSKSVETSNKMNQWVEEKTNHLIKNLINADSLTPETALFLINTLYFKSKWLKPFSPYSLFDSTFYNIDGSLSEIKYIFAEGRYSVANNDELKVDVLQLRYELNSGFMFWIIVPHQGSSLDELKSKLNPQFINKVNASLTMSTASIKFPPFTIESGVDGKDISKVLFQKAELKMLKNSGPLRVDEIKQKTKIIVNTDGTEAASSTYASAVPASMYFGQRKTFTADRPFLFAILTDYNEPVFIGHYVKGN